MVPKIHVSAAVASISTRNSSRASALTPSMVLTGQASSGNTASRAALITEYSSGLLKQKLAKPSGCLLTSDSYRAV